MRVARRVAPWSSRVVLLATGALVGTLGFGAGAAGAPAVDLPLIEAAKTADPVAVRALLRQQADVDAAEADGTTALHWAAYKGDVETARLLLRAGARVDARNRYHVTPLELAAGRGSAPLVEALLVAGADPNSTRPEGETVLMAAARTGSVDVLRLLLAHGADVGAREDWRGQTALHWAAAENHAPAVHALVELGADVDARSHAGWSALLFAVRAGRQEAVRALLEAGADPNDIVRPPAAGDEGNDAGPRDPTIGTSALVIAVMNARFSLAQYLVGQGADPNAAEQGWAALHQLAYTRRPNSGKGMPPVEMVDPVDTLAFARFLLEHGADPNTRQTERFNNRERNNLNRIGATPYLLAAKHADVPLMRLLAEHGADTLLPTRQASASSTSGRAPEPTRKRSTPSGWPGSWATGTSSGPTTAATRRSTAPRCGGRTRLWSSSPNVTPTCSRRATRGGRRYGLPTACTIPARSSGPITPPRCCVASCRSAASTPRSTSATSTASRWSSRPAASGHGSHRGSGAIIVSELRLIRSPSGFLMRNPLASIRWPVCADGSG